jgi:hypothetical protein
MKLSRQQVSRHATWCAGSWALAWCLTAIVAAAEPNCPTCPPTAGITSREDVWLTRLPMIGRLFWTQSTGNGSAGCPDACGAVAMDLKFCPALTGTARALQVSGVTCRCTECACCPCGGQGNTAISTGTGSSVAASCAAACAASPGTNCSECKGCPEQCLAAQTARQTNRLIVAHQPLSELHRLLTRVNELTAAKAAAESALEARQEAYEQLGEFFETMADLAAENAALEAKLAAHAEHAQLAEKLAELAAENVRLKAHLELAAERAETVRSAHQVALENERLKFRVAELEKSQATATAARPRGEKKPR